MARNRSYPGLSRFPNWQIVASTALVAIVCGASIWRIVQFFTHDPPLPGLAFSHGVNLFLTAILALVVMSTPLFRRRPVRMVFSLVLAAILTLLAAYDVLKALSARFGDTFFSFVYLADIWCASKIDGACLASYPTFFAAVAAIYISIAVLVYRLVPPVESFITFMDARASKHLRLSRRAGLTIASSTVLAATVWEGTTIANEPVRQLFEAPFEQGPVELLKPSFADVAPVAPDNLAPRPLVLIIVDSLRADAVGLEAGQQSLTPYLRSLHRANVLHDASPAYSACNSSYCGILATLTSAPWSSLQRQPGPPLQEVLKAHGYETHFVLSGEHRRLANIFSYYERGLDTFADDQSADDRMIAENLERLPFANPSRSFVYIHLMSAHSMGRRWMEGGGAAARSNAPAWQPEIVGKPALRRHYRSGVRQADRVIRDIFAMLRAKGLLPDALVVITADHGERLGERGLFAHNGTPDPAVSRIPLLIYDERQDISYGGGIASQIDVAPTLVRAIGGAIPAAWRGKPLQDLPRLAAPIDSRLVTAVAFGSPARELLYACHRSGREELWNSSFEPIREKDFKRLLIAGRRMRDTLERRTDISPCG